MINIQFQNFKNYIMETVVVTHADLVFCGGHFRLGEHLRRLKDW